MPAGLGIRPGDGGALLPLKVSPGSAREEIRGVLGDRLKVSVRTPPEKGKANRAVCALLESALGLPKGTVAIVTGATASAKTAFVRDVSPDDLRERIRRTLEDRK